MMSYLILSPIFVPIIAGIALLLLPDKVFGGRRGLLISVGVIAVVSALLGMVSVSGVVGSSIRLFDVARGLSVFFNIDNFGRLFAVLVTFIFVLISFYSFVYMAHEKNERRFYAFYLMTYGVLMGLSFSGNMVTMYMFYELMTLVSFPLVLHNGSREAVMAALKYLMYSFCGAYMALFGIYYLYKYTETLDFAAGGAAWSSGFLTSGSTGLMLVAVFFQCTRGFRRRTLQRLRLRRRFCREL